MRRRADEEDYCIRELFNVSCPSSSPRDVILMTSAKYGRMRASRCINSNNGHLGCLADVTSQLDEACSGRHGCTYPVKDLMDVNPVPCPDDLFSFLIASYACVKGRFCWYVFFVFLGILCFLDFMLF